MGQHERRASRPYRNRSRPSQQRRCTNCRTREGWKTIGAESFAYDFLPATWDDGDARKRKIRIKHLTTMTSGLVPDDKPGQPNYLNVVLTQPVKVPPETEWSYASLPVDLLSIVIRSAGTTVRDFFNQESPAKSAFPHSHGGPSGGHCRWTC